MNTQSALNVWYLTVAAICTSQNYALSPYSVMLNDLKQPCWNTLLRTLVTTAVGG